MSVSGSRKVAMKKIDSAHLLKTPHGAQIPLMKSVEIIAMIATNAGMNIQIVIRTEIRTTRFLTFCYNHAA